MHDHLLSKIALTLVLGLAATGLGAQETGCYQDVKVRTG